MLENCTTMPKGHHFPEGFIWGAATASHQVEGRKKGALKDKSNWTEWEDSNEREESLRKEGLIKKHGLSNYISGRGCEFHLSNRWKKDLRRMQSFGMKALRISFDWAKIEPERGRFNMKEIERYRDMFDFADTLGIELIPTFHHFTHPLWFEKGGGWLRDDAPELFGIFCEKVMRVLGKRGRHFTVINEANIYAMFSYLFTNEWPPHAGSEEKWKVVLENLARAHIAAYFHIKSFNPDALVGVAHSFGWHTADTKEVKEREDKKECAFVDRIKLFLDFVGVNVYMHNHHGADNRMGWEGNDVCVPQEIAVVSDLNWGMCPRAVYEVLKQVYARYKLPVMVTEHGQPVAEMKDGRRSWYLWESLKWILQATQEGVPVMGYLHWSLMDNFEWKFGYWPRFGLWHINRLTLTRTPRRSAYLYRDICFENGLTQAIREKYHRILAHPKTRLLGK